MSTHVADDGERPEIPWKLVSCEGMHPQLCLTCPQLGLKRTLWHVRCDIFLLHLEEEGEAVVCRPFGLVNSVNDVQVLHIVNGGVLLDFAL